MRSKKAKMPTKIFRPTNLQRGQISEISPKRGQSGNPVYESDKRSSDIVD